MWCCWWRFSVNSFDSCSALSNFQVGTFLLFILFAVMAVIIIIVQWNIMPIHFAPRLGGKREFCIVLCCITWRSCVNDCIHDHHGHKKLYTYACLVNLVMQQNWTGYITNERIWYWHADEEDDDQCGNRKYTYNSEMCMQARNASCLEIFFCLSSCLMSGSELGNW